MVKRILVPAILVATILLGGYGCMNNQQNINDAALAYMGQKYGEKFEYISPWGSSYTTPGKRQILVSCGSLPGKEILIVIKDDGEAESYSDNYMDFYYEIQTSDYIKQVASNYFTDFTIEISIRRTPSSDGVSREMGFDDYIRDKNNFVSGNIDINDSDRETVQAFINELKELGVHFSFGIDIISVDEGYTAQYFNSDDDVYLNRRATP